MRDPRFPSLVVGSSVVVAVRADRGSVVSASHWLVVLKRMAWGSDRGASIGRVVRRAVVMAASRRKTTRDGDGADFRIAKTLGAAVALPELCARALGVAVGGAGAECLLLLVIAAQAELDEGRDEEEESAEDRDGEAGRVEPADGTQRGGVGDLVTLAVTTESFL